MQKDFELTRWKFSSCTCDVCKAACEQKPGWFIPNQINAIEGYFGKTLRELVGNELIIDFYYKVDEDILVLSPNIVGSESIIFPYEPGGKCVFFAEGMCTVYPLRPYECKVMLHDMQPGKRMVEVHKAVAKLWSTSRMLKDFGVEVPTPT